jgi:F-type H+-transporting ATPase subunit gamma
MAGSSMRDIKRRIRSVRNIEHITNAMKLVSAAKLRRAKNIFEKTQEYLHYITDRIDEIFANVEEIPGRYLLGSSEIKRTCYIVITSNRGLAGSYNANVIKAAEQQIKADIANGKEKPLLVCIGNKGLSYFTKRDHEVFAGWLDPPENISFVQAEELMEPVVELFDRDGINEIVIIGTTFVSTIEQRARAKRLLPFEAAGTSADSGTLKGGRQVEYEPSAEDVLSHLVSKYVLITIWQCIIEAATCEHGARRMAMQNATDNAREMMDNLELFFNRARQAAITREITEIVSGADAIKK